MYSIIFCISVTKDGCNNAREDQSEKARQVEHYQNLVMEKTDGAKFLQLIDVCLVLIVVRDIAVRRF